MYDGSWGSVLWFRARADSLVIHGRTHNWAEREDTCRMCKLRERESEEHVVLECRTYEEESACLRKNIVSTVSRGGFIMGATLT